MACGCKKKTSTGIEALSLFPHMEGNDDMAEVFNSVAAGIKAEVLPKTYFIRASDAAKFNNRNRYLKVTSSNQLIPEPIRDWLVADSRYRKDFVETESAAAEVVAAPVVFAQLPELYEATVVDELASEAVVEVDLDSDTLYIQAYDANMLFADVDEDDFAEMNLAELQLYVTHNGIDIGRATSETTIRERVVEWYQDANAG